jgi:hypothetical protein
MIVTIQATDSRTGELTHLRVIPGESTVAIQCKPIMSLELTAEQARDLSDALSEWADPPAPAQSNGGVE